MSERYLSNKPGMGNEDIFVGNMSKPMFVVSDEQAETNARNEVDAVYGVARYALQEGIGAEAFVRLIDLLGLGDQTAALLEEHESPASAIKFQVLRGRAQT